MQKLSDEFRRSGRPLPGMVTEALANYQPDPIWQSMQKWFKDYKLQKHLDGVKPIRE